jgi:hypothetical protein
MTTTKKHRQSLKIDFENINQDDDEEEIDLDRFESNENSTRKPPRKHSHFSCIAKQAQQQYSTRSSRDHSPSSVYSNYIDWNPSATAKHQNNRPSTGDALQNEIRQRELEYTFRVTRVLEPAETKGGDALFDRYMKQRMCNFVDGKYSMKLENAAPFRPNYLDDVRRPVTSLMTFRKNTLLSFRSSPSKTVAKSWRGDGGNGSGDETGRGEPRSALTERNTQSNGFVRSKSALTDIGGGGGDGGGGGVRRGGLGGATVHMTGSRRLMSAPAQPKPPPRSTSLSRQQGHDEDERGIKINTISRPQRMIKYQSMDLDKWVDLKVSQSRRFNAKNYTPSSRPTSVASSAASGDKSRDAMLRKLGALMLKNETMYEPIEAVRIRSLRQLAELTTYDRVQAKQKKQLQEKLKMLQQMETEQEFNETVEKMKSFLEELEEFKLKENSIHNYYFNYANPNYQKDVVESAARFQVDKDKDVEEEEAQSRQVKKKRRKGEKRRKREKEEDKKAKIPPEILKLSQVTLYDLTLV